MKIRYSYVLPSFIVSVILMICMDIFLTTVLPSIGLSNLKLAFNCILILYLGFKINIPVIPIFILIIQVCHSIFSIESWAYGTFAGIVICMIINFLRNILHLSTNMSTILIVLLFQTLWHLIISSLIFIKLGTFYYGMTEFLFLIFEVVFLSLISPFVFKVLDFIWERYQLETQS